MNEAKERRKVNIYCSDGSCLMGFIHIDPGKRIIDFINDLQEIFIVVSEVEFYYPEQDMRSFRLIRRSAITKKDSIILQKSLIKWIEEV